MISTVSFSLVSGGTVTNQLGYFGTCSWADYNNDGFLDLLITDTGTSKPKVSSMR